MISIWLLAAALNGVIGVAAGAAAGHLFADDPHGLQLMSTGAQYGLVHALALLGVAALRERATVSRGGAWSLVAAGWLFVAGTVLFAWGLDLHALTGDAAFGRAAPWGGTAFMLGWAALGVHGLFRGREPS